MSDRRAAAGNFGFTFSVGTGFTIGSVQRFAVLRCRPFAGEALLKR